ncbi:hypothetical protein M430DRAFT_255238 [Amorphotheca resinae ATCC 22711]|jgi:hypothetical protein|uniref:Uncharacterized protein n=1 Tax=Amorphotheca resinae ATCC 22711 TaxID=857342 RepID=A0A2T3AY13_AMORE|nr:hypothetical protein M430DRAFT_255238 [Amorphotheca resinae ATCC 22711]PSS14966.1 hypothetical protein M430DRAFT_255238 [Amorphotheca resinae ATCC 22711]
MIRSPIPMYVRRSHSLSSQLTMRTRGSKSTAPVTGSQLRLNLLVARTHASGPGHHITSDQILSRMSCLTFLNGGCTLFFSGACLCGNTKKRQEEEIAQGTQPLWALRHRRTPRNGLMDGWDIRSGFFSAFLRTAEPAALAILQVAWTID